MPPDLRADVLVIGGGLGGVAAALAATRLGRTVIMTEPTDWLGGQLTSQAVPPDEHPWIEHFGCTTSYRQLRDGIRGYYHSTRLLTATAAADPALNPGRGWVSGLCSEPRAALNAIGILLTPAIATGQLRVLRRCYPLAVEMEGDRVAGVRVRDERAGVDRWLTASYVLDATETGELLALSGCEHVTGSESGDQTSEPHAATEARPDNLQALTWCLAMANDPDQQRELPEPDGWDFWRNFAPQLSPPWPGPLLSWAYCSPVGLAPQQAKLFDSEPDPTRPALFSYRRIVSRNVVTDRRHEVTLVNWPQNDYLLSGHHEQARQLSLCLLHWLRTEATRPDGGQGYPGLYADGHLMGTTDGLAKAPYIRESRRIQAAFTVTENHVGQVARGSLQGAEPFADSVGVGAYRIDLHPTTGGDNYLDLACWPFQIPLGALLPVRVENLLPACKNLGVTHITNGCYRLHPVEWNVGEASGALAAYCLRRQIDPRGVLANPSRLAEYQALLIDLGVELAWPSEALRPL